MKFQVLSWKVEKSYNKTPYMRLNFSKTKEEQSNQFCEIIFKRKIIFSWDYLCA